MDQRRIGVIALSLALSASLAAQTAEQKGTEWVRRMEDRPESSAEISSVLMTVTDRRGRIRERELAIYRMTEGGREYSAIFFRNPADVRGVGFLTVEDEDGDSDQWLYMPALSRTQRIASSSKDDSFMGTDFTYEDLEPRDADNERHRYLRDETEGGALCHVVESRPVGTSGYSRRISWIDPETLHARRIDFYDRRDVLEKRLIVPDLRYRDGYWSAWRMEMSNLQEGRSTVLAMDDIDTGADLERGFFRVATLERGVEP